MQNNLLSIAREVLRKWPFIFAVTAIVAVTVILIPARYRVSTSIMMVEVNQFGQNALLPVTLEAGPNPIDITHRIFRSDYVTSQIAEKIGMNRDKVGAYIGTSLDMSANSITFYVDEWESNISKAKLALNAGLESLEKKTSDIAFSKAKIKADYLEKATSNAYDKLRISRAKLLEAQRKTAAGTSPASLKVGLPFSNRVAELRFELGTVNAQLAAAGNEGERLSKLNETSVSAIPSLEEWRRKIVEMEFEIQKERVAYGDEAPHVRAKSEALAKAKQAAASELSAQMKAVKMQVTKEQLELLSRKTVLSWQLDEANRLVKIATTEADTLSDLHLEYESNEAVYSQLNAQLRQAKVESEVDLVRWRVLEPPYISYRPTNKRFVAYSAYAFVASILLVAIYHEWNRKAKQ